MRPCFGKDNDLNQCCDCAEPEFTKCGAMRTLKILAEVVECLRTAEPVQCGLPAWPEGTETVKSITGEAKAKHTKKATSRKTTFRSPIIDDVERARKRFIEEGPK